MPPASTVVRIISFNSAYSCRYGERHVFAMDGNAPFSGVAQSVMDGVYPHFSIIRATSSLTAFCLTPAPPFLRALLLRASGWL